MAQFPGYRIGWVVQWPLFWFTVGEIIDDVFCVSDRGPPYIMVISSFFWDIKRMGAGPEVLVLMGFVQT